MTSFIFKYKLTNKNQTVEQFTCEVATKGEANALNHIVESVVNEIYPLSDGYRFLSGIVYGGVNVTGYKPLSMITAYKKLFIDNKVHRNVAHKWAFENVYMMTRHWAKGRVQASQERYDALAAYCNFVGVDFDKTYNEALKRIDQKYVEGYRYKEAGWDKPVIEGC